MQKVEENELIRLLKAKEKMGFDYLYQNYSEAIYGIIFRMVNNAQVAEDLLQDVFIKIWQNVENYNPNKGRFFTWMLNLSKNLVIDKLRSANYKYHYKNLEISDISQNKIEQNQNRSQNVDTIGLREIVKNMKAEHKQLIELAYFSGYTQAEIAEQLEIPLGTVKTRLRAAIAELKIKFS